MTTPVLVALTGSALESSVVMALQQHSERAGVHIVRRCVDVADLLAAAATGRAVAALVAADLPHLDADVVAALRASGVEPLGVASDDSAATANRLHQIGIGAVLVAGGSADLATEVVECLERRDLAASSIDPTGAAPETEESVPAGLGEVVAVWGPAGAPGRTTVAVGLATELSELAELGHPALLVDADVYGGAVAQHLAMLDDVSGLLAAARNAKAGVLDPAALAAHCRTVGRARVLTGLPRPDRWPELSPAAMSAVLASARALSSYVVVDCGFSLESDEDLMFDTAAPRRNGATLCVLEQADRVLAVGTADPVGLSRLARGVVDLTVAVPGCRPTVVVNRMRHSLGWSAAEATAMIERFTGHSPGVVLPEDRAACDKALVHGSTLAEVAPTSALRTALRDLAAGIAGVSPPGTRRRRRLGRVPQSAGMSPPAAPHALIVDWGGVLTERLDLAVRTWADREGIDFDHYLEAMRRWFSPEEQLEAEINPIHAIERGEITVPDFEARLAGEIRRLDRHPVKTDGLLERMFESFETAHAMNALVARAKRRGIRTALLSNSWGNRYPRDGWQDMFDVVVISGEVGMRKPEPEIFELTAGRLRVDAGLCVFVDDLRVNVEAAGRLGMTGILHRSYEQTAARLEELFGVPLS